MVGAIDVLAVVCYRNGSYHSSCYSSLATNILQRRSVLVLIVVVHVTTIIYYTGSMLDSFVVAMASIDGFLNCCAVLALSVIGLLSIAPL